MVVRATTPGIPIQSPTTPAPRAVTTASPARFSEVLAQMRTSPPAPATTAVHPTPHAPQPADAFTAAGRQLVTRVARGERYVENIVRQAVGGRAFSPAD